jgi:hypothetical protein
MFSQDVQSYFPLCSKEEKAPTLSILELPIIEEEFWWYRR